MYEVFYEDSDGVLYFNEDKHNIYWAHAIVYKYNKSTWYKILAVWEEAMESFSKKGIEFVCVYCPEENKKLKKFLKKLGFDKTIVENKYDVYFYETGVN